MKRVGNLYQDICSFDNCRMAIIEASRKKRKRKNVQKILKNLDAYAQKLSNLLRNHEYEPAEYSVRWINDGIKQKRRRLAKPRFWPDQCVHHALDRVMAPVMTKGMYYYCTGSVKGRGEARSKRGLELFLKRHPDKAKYVFKMDISHYYDSIPHEKLMETLRRHIKDEEVLDLYKAIIDSYPRLAKSSIGRLHGPKDEKFLSSLDRIAEEEPQDPERGIPIGIDPSRWLCNLLLQDLDHEIKRFLGKDYFATRYVDDIVVVGPNKRRLHKLRRLICDRLKDLDLAMKKNWQVFRLACRPIDFLGYKFYKDKTTIRKTVLKRIKRKIRRVASMAKVSFTNAAGMISHMGKVKRSNSIHFRKKYIDNVISMKRLRKVVSHEGKIRREAERRMGGGFDFQGGRSVPDPRHGECSGAA